MGFAMNTGQDWPLRRCWQPEQQPKRQSPKQRLNSHSPTLKRKRQDEKQQKQMQLPKQQKLQHERQAKQPRWPARKQRNLQQRRQQTEALIPQRFPKSS